MQRLSLTLHLVGSITGLELGRWLCHAGSLLFFWRARARGGQAPKTRGQLLQPSIPGCLLLPLMITKEARVQTETVPLIVPKGVAVQVALDKEVRVRKVGQPIIGHVVEPVYAFDKLVVPVGTTAAGQITKIEGISNGKRTLNALDAEFTPAHKIDVEFTEFILPDGKHLSIHTRVTPGSGQLIQFVTGTDADQQKGVKDPAAEKAKGGKGGGQARMGLRNPASERARKIAQGRAIRGRSASSAPAVH